MALQSRAEKNAALVADLDGHFYQTMNFGGWVKLTVRGKLIVGKKQPVKIVIRDEYVQMLKQFLKIVDDDVEIKVHERVITTQKDLDAFVQVATQNLGRGRPSIACILEPME